MTNAQVRTPETVEATLSLAKLILAFGRTMRVTHHEDGERLESDTDHTVMLGIMATAFAARFVPHLDAGKISQFALVHDLVEVYASDTPTFRILSEEDKQEKEKREHASLVRIKDEFDAVYPWISTTIEEYESLHSPEARFVKLFDKILPKLIHVLNKGATARKLGHTKNSVDAFHFDQFEKLSKGYGSDQPEAMSLLKEFIDAMRDLRFNDDAV